MISALVGSIAPFLVMYWSSWPMISVLALDEPADRHLRDVRALAGVARVAKRIVGRQVAERVRAQVLRVLDAVERGRVTRSFA